MTTNRYAPVFDPTPFLADFREESGELLRGLDEELMRVEQDPGELEAFRRMFLSVHTIKGGASMLRLPEVSELAHALEDVLARIQRNALPIDRGAIELLFRAADMLRELTEQERPGSGEPGRRATGLAAHLRERATTGSPPALSSGIVTEPAGVTDDRVLLVEDSPTVRMLVSMLLAKAGFRVEAVTDGREALALAQSAAYGLVISSMEVRGLRGLELAAALRASPTCRDIPIILMSSDDDPEHRRQAFRTGVQAYIRKGSFDRWRLLETVRELLPGSVSAAMQS